VTGDGRKTRPAALWAGGTLIALALLALPFALAAAGTTWVRITNLAILYVFLSLGAAVAALFGVLIGAPTLKLRGDYLAIVTLGFGEIVRIFLNNLSQPVNITNGPQGIARIDPFRLGGVDFSKSESFLGLVFSGPIKYYYLLLAVLLAVIFVNVRLQNSRIGRAWEAVREDE